MTAKLTGALRAAPATVPGVAAIALFALWASDQAGYPVTHWGPGGVVVLGLLVIAAAALRPRVAEMALPARVALASLAAYTALSYLSILWASVPGDAWEGANRTLLYLLVFALFAGWPQRGATAAMLLCLWTLALIALAAYAALHIDAAGSAALQKLVPGGRLDYPSGYPNANAAQWLTAFWPALLLARSERLPWALRGVLAGGAVLLAEVALLSQSRGSLYVTPVMLVLVFVLLPGRVRTFALLVPVAGAIAVAAPSVLRVGDHLLAGRVLPANVHGAVAAAFLAAFAAALIVGLGAAIESRRELSPQTRTRVHRGVGVVAIAALVLVLAGGLAAAGNPVHRLQDAWHSFKGGYSTEGSSSNRLLSGLGSNRYDFYRVALDEFLAHPLVGVGADNYSQQYLLHGRSRETPHYPHSVELRVLSQTGAIGALLALIGLGAALLAAARAMRHADPLGCTVAAAALAGFGYWAVHGSLDWLWEFAGLGAPAFAMLGIACALAPRRVGAESRARTAAAGPSPRTPRGELARALGELDPHERPGALDEGNPREPGDSREHAYSREPAHRHGRTRRAPRRAAAALPIAGGALVALVLAYTLAAPWLSELQVQRAARIWTRTPGAAYADLNDAARLDPLSAEAYLVAGSIALRYGEVAYADHEFSLALARSPGDAYATLERGAIASAQGRRGAAVEMLRRAVALDPRDELAGAALRLALDGRRINLGELNGAILQKAQQLS